MNETTMKISNYQLREIAKSQYLYSNSQTITATIDVTTGFWLWKKTKTRNIYCRSGSIYYRFEDTGEFTPTDTVENLARAYFAQNGLYEYT